MNVAMRVGDGRLLDFISDLNFPIFRISVIACNLAAETLLGVPDWKPIKPFFEYIKGDCI